MKKLSKDHEKKIAELEARWAEKREALVEAIEEAKSELEKINSNLENARADLNQIVSEANDLRAEIAAEIESYVDTKSDSWREGEKGSAYADWQDRWETEIEEVEEVEIGAPEDVDLGDLFNEEEFAREPAL